MRYLQCVLLAVAVAFVVVPFPSGWSAAQETVPDTDGDGYADDNDICPHDAQNNCKAAELCQELENGIGSSEQKASDQGWATFVLGLIGLALGAISLGLSVVVFLYGMLHYAHGKHHEKRAKKLREAMDKAGCNDKLGWR